MIIQKIKAHGGITLEKIIIEGKTKLKGEVTVSGAKNAAVAILPATILVNGICRIENIPNISDIKAFCKILEALGVKINKLSENTLEIDTRNIQSVEAPLDLTSKFRASYYLTGALLGRCGRAIVGMPGGCKLGARPMDQHIKAFEALRSNSRNRARENRSKGEKAKRKFNIFRYSICWSNNQCNACGSNCRRHNNYRKCSKRATYCRFS